MLTLSGQKIKDSTYRVRLGLGWVRLGTVGTKLHGHAHGRRAVDAHDVQNIGVVWQRYRIQTNTRRDAERVNVDSLPVLRWDVRFL